MHLSCRGRAAGVNEDAALAKFNNGAICSMAAAPKAMAKEGIELRIRGANSESQYVGGVTRRRGEMAARRALLLSNGG